MTKEELLNSANRREYNVNGVDYISETIPLYYLKEFFEANVCIPKGENRHPYADVLHQWIEGAVIEFEEEVYLEPSYSLLPSSIEYLNDSSYSIKPSEPVYEWQWLEDGMVQNLGFYTEEELEDYPNKVYERIKETKRERK